MKLTFKERIVLPSMMPGQGNRMEQETVKDILDKAKVGHTEREAAKVKTLPRGNLIWDDEAARKFEREFQFTAQELRFMKKQAKRLDEGKLVDQDNLSLCQKFEDAKVEEEKKAPEK